MNKAPFELTFGADIVDGDRQEGQVVEHNGDKWKLVLIRDNDVDLVFLHVEKSVTRFIGAYVDCFFPDNHVEPIFVRFVPNCNEVRLCPLRGEIQRFRCEIRTKEAPKDSKRKKLIDFSDPKLLKFTDAVVVVDGKEFHVNKGTLSDLSTKFESIFEKDLDQKRFPLDLVKAKQLQLILQVILYKTDITGDNILEVLEIAHLLGISRIVCKCINALDNIPEISSATRIQVADRLGIDQLMVKQLLITDNKHFQDATLAKCTTTSQVKAALPEHLEELKESTVRILLQKVATSRDEPARPDNHQHPYQYIPDNEIRGPFMNGPRMRDFRDIMNARVNN